MFCTAAVKMGYPQGRTDLHVSRDNDAKESVYPHNLSPAAPCEPIVTSPTFPDPFPNPIGGGAGRGRLDGSVIACRGARCGKRGAPTHRTPRRQRSGLRLATSRPNRPSGSHGSIPMRRASRIQWRSPTTGPGMSTRVRHSPPSVPNGSCRLCSPHSAASTRRPGSESTDSRGARLVDPDRYRPTDVGWRDLLTTTGGRSSRPRTRLRR